MVDRKEEILKFVKSNLKDLLQVDFLEKLYKDNKRKFFYELLKNQIGIPKDGEIATVAINYLFKIKKFRNLSELKDTLQLPFFLRNISDRDYFIEKYQSETTKSEIDFKEIHNADYQYQIMERAKKEVMSTYAEEIGALEKKKQELIDSIPSVLDTQTFVEPNEEIEDNYDSNNNYLPWWKKLALREDPFPTIDGLGDISDDDYEEIIVKTSIYEKLVSFIQYSPQELFKNTIYYGQFGSGKTTLFEYLQKPMIRNKIYAMLIRLSAEPDYQNFLIRFKQKLFHELQRIYKNLSGGASDFSFISQPTLLDENIIEILRHINSKFAFSGIVIFIDDIYKIKDYDHVAFKFLNHLQTFKGELTKDTGLNKIGFSISAPLEWYRQLNEDLSYSGSVSRQETMPMITINEALRMLNNRMETFAVNKENSKKFNKEFVQQIYRKLESKHALTFRQFIKEAVKRFDDGDFDILTSNPVIIHPDKLKKIRTLFERNSAISEGIEGILESSTSSKNKSLCFQVLIQIYLKKGEKENSEFFKNRTYHFGQLKKFDLIYKSRNELGETVWKISPELSKLSEKIFTDYSYSLEDYFFKIYKEVSLMEESTKNIGRREEILTCQSLIELIKNKKHSEFKTIQLLLSDSLKHHKEITRLVEAPSINVESGKLKKDCHDSIELITRAAAIYYGYRDVVNINEFWNDFWNYPDSVSEYIKRSSLEVSTDSDIWYIVGAYESAFKDIVEFLNQQIRKSAIFEIPLKWLKPEEILEFNNIRDEFQKKNYYEVVTMTSKLVEMKIREFLYNIFVIQYGGQNNRAKRIPTRQRQYIDGNMEKDRKEGYEVGFNEFFLLNRNDYLDIFVSENSPGDKNWVHTFSKIFSGWNKNKMREFFKTFGNLNLTTAHYKTYSLTREHENHVYTYILNSIDLIRMINKSYIILLKSIHIIVTDSTPKYQYFFSLDEGKDINELKQITISTDNAKRIVDVWKRSKQNYFDLSNQQLIEQKYGTEYRQLFAILAVLLKQKPNDIEIIKENSPFLATYVR